jgi:tRNA A-37 threonylcarbamoyl transferase component Bud32
MPSWEPYSLAIVRGGLRALPLTPGVQADALRALEETAGFADARALAALEERAGGGAPGVTPNPVELGELERLASRASEALAAAERDAQKGLAKALAIEEEPVARGQAARELAARLVRALVADSTLAGKLAQASRPKPDALAPGALVASRYRLADRLGKGGFGTVWKAHDQELNEDVALKVLNADVAQNEEARERFLKEVKSTRAFVHKYAVQPREFGRDTERNVLFFTMGLVAGPTLRKVLEKERTLGAARAARVGAQVLEALEEAHGAGIVHRDLKPENMILTKSSKGEEEVRILDFGIAKAISHAKQNTTGLTLTGTTVGTLAYMSPEQAQGKKLDGRSDLYSVAAILYECLAGRKPIEPEPDAEDENQSLLFNLAVKVPDDLATAVPGTPAPLAAAIQRALAKKADERFATAREMRDALLAPASPASARETATGLPTGPQAAAAPASASVTGLPRSVSAKPQESVTGLPTGGRAAVAEGAAHADPKTKKGRAWTTILGVLVVAVVLLGVVLVADAGVRARLLSSLGVATPSPPPASSAPPVPVVVTRPGEAAPLAFVELDPPAGKTMLLKEAALVVHGKLSDASAGSVRIGEPGKQLIETPLNPDGSFEARVGLEPGAKVVSVRAGAGTREIKAEIPVEIDLDPPEVTLEPPGTWRGGSVSLTAHVKAAHGRLARFSLVAEDRVVAGPIERALDSGGQATATLEAPRSVPRSLVARVEAEDTLGRTKTAEAAVAIDRDGTYARAERALADLGDG